MSAKGTAAEVKEVYSELEDMKLDVIRAGAIIGLMRLCYECGGREVESVDTNSVMFGLMDMMERCEERINMIIDMLYELEEKQKMEGGKHGKTGEKGNSGSLPGADGIAGEGV